MPQDLGAGQLRDRLSCGQCSRGLFDIEPIDFDPAPARLHERARLTGKALHVVGGQLGVVEEYGPRDVAELAGTDDRALRRIREEPQRSLRLAPRQRRQPHVEADRAPASGPTTVMNSHASSWLMATWPRRVTPVRSSAGTSRTSRCHSPLSRRRPASVRIAVSNGTTVFPGGGEDRHEPHAAGQRRIELHEQARAHRVGHRTRPLIQLPRHRRWPAPTGH